MKINVLLLYSSGLGVVRRSHPVVLVFVALTLAGMTVLFAPMALWAESTQAETTNASINSNADIKADTKINRLGRLFFTVEQRALLDQQRRSGLISADPSISKGYSIDGFIRQKEGSGTAWVNGYEVPLKSQTDSVHLPGLMNQPLRVGEVVDPKTGEAQDILPPGQTIRQGK